MKHLHKFFIFFAFILAVSSCGKNKANKTFISIGTGSVTGVYYPIGGMISKIINQNTKNHQIKVSYESTGGSVFNINLILNGDLDFGIAQADRQYQATKGQAEWSKIGPQTNLRAVFSLHSESITLIASGKSKIISLQDLKSKRVNIGNYGSGHRQNAIDILNFHQIDIKKDIKIQNVKAAEASSLLQDDRIDAFFYTVGHPNGSIKEASSFINKVRIIPIKASKKLLEKNPYYTASTIPISYYPNLLNKQSIETIGIRAGLITSSKTSKQVVYALTKAIFENLETFKKIHPALNNLNKKGMTKNLAIPLHQGAIKYYQEIGLL